MFGEDWRGGCRARASAFGVALRESGEPGESDVSEHLSGGGRGHPGTQSAVWFLHSKFVKPTGCQWGCPGRSQDGGQSPISEESQECFLDRRKATVPLRAAGLAGPDSWSPSPNPQLLTA